MEMVITGYGKQLESYMGEIHSAELSRLGEDEGTYVCEPYVKTVQDAAAWYLLTYGKRALKLIEEHARMSLRGFEDKSCFGHRYRDVRDFLAEKCFQLGVAS